MLLGDRFVAAASAAECGDVVGVVMSVAVATPLPTADVVGEPVALATVYAVVAVPAPGDSELGGVVLDDKRRTMATLTALLAAGPVVAIRWLVADAKAAAVGDVTAVGGGDESDDDEDDDEDDDSDEDDDDDDEHDRTVADNAADVVKVVDVVTGVVVVLSFFSFIILFYLLSGALILFCFLHSCLFITALHALFQNYL